MPNLTTEKLEKSLDDKLHPLSEQFKQVLESISLLNKKYENIQETLTKLEKDKMALLEENARHKAQSLSIANDLMQVKKSLNDSEQYTRRECAEICGIPLSGKPSMEDTNDIIIQLSKKIGVTMERNNISVSHRIPSARGSVDPAIVVKFVRHELRENLYHARKKAEICLYDWSWFL